MGAPRPNLYRLMFTTPANDPHAAVRSVERAQDLFLQIVATAVGADRARQYAALLLPSTHGITGLEQAGHLTWQKWHCSAEDLVELLISLLPKSPS